jgi:hypothetical protein
MMLANIGRDSRRHPAPKPPVSRFGLYSEAPPNRGLLPALRRRHRVYRDSLALGEPD